MTTLRALTEAVEEGDRLAWMAEQSVDEVNQTHPFTVTGIDVDGGTIRVEAEGIRGGQYCYDVEPTGESIAYFDDPNTDTLDEQGPVVFAHLAPASDGMVDVLRGRFINGKQGAPTKHSG